MDALDITGNTVIHAHLRERLGLHGHMIWFNSQTTHIPVATKTLGKHLDTPYLKPFKETMLIIQSTIRRYTDA